jgi:N-acetylmuramoyl-L-alanine amidase
VFPQKVSAVVLDRYGNPVADSTSVAFSWKAGSAERPTVGGRASVYVSKDIPFGQRSITAACGTLRGSIVSPSSELAADRSITGFVTGIEGDPVEGARIACTAEPEWTLSDPDGYFTMSPRRFPDRLRVSKQGYRAQYVDVSDEAYPDVMLARFYSGIPPEAVVTIDPRGGGDDTGWTAPSGATASDLNLAVARRLAALLTSAGIEAHLTRESDRRIAPQDRIAVCEAARSTLVVSIGHSAGSAEQVHLGHYPGSRGGIRLSGYLREELGTREGVAPTVGETDHVIVLHTSCPAVHLDFTSRRAVGGRAVISSPFSIWDRAYGMFCAIVRYLHLNEAETFSVTGTVACEEPCAHTLILVDGTFEAITDDAGRFHLKLLERVTHTAQALSARGKSDLVVFGHDSGPITIPLY